MEYMEFWVVNINKEPPEVISIHKKKPDAYDAKDIAEMASIGMGSGEVIVVIRKEI